MMNGINGFSNGYASGYVSPYQNTAAPGPEKSGAVVNPGESSAISPGRVFSRRMSDLQEPKISGRL